jgi:hypothetical protein
MKQSIGIMCCVLALTACTSNLKKENEALREEIDERRENLEVSIQENLATAREQLAVTDSLLNIARREHDEQHEWVMSHATELDEQSPEVLRLNSLRARRDSLQVEFEKQAQKVKFYMRKSEK